MAGQTKLGFSSKGAAQKKEGKGVREEDKSNGASGKRSRPLAESDESDDEEPPKKDVKRGAKADSEDDDYNDKDEEEKEEEDAEKEEEEEREEGKAVKQLASIFLKKQPPTESDASWKQGQPTPYSAMAQAFAEIEATTKRLAILEILTKLLVKVVKLSPEDLLPCVYLCINRLCPDYEGLELGIGESILVKSIAQSTGRDVARIKKDLEAKGDLGLVAIGSRQKQPTMFKSAALTVRSVFKQLKEIAAMAGNKSQERKIGGIKKLLAASQGEEPKYIMRSLEGKLRIGLAEKTVVVALAQSIVLAKSKHPTTETLEKAVETVKSVYSELPSYDIVVPTLLRVGVEGLRTECKLTPGVPLKPMLAKPTKAIGEVLDRFEGKPFVCEYKYDGERAQVHWFVDEDGKRKVTVFSRNSENMSVKYPDLVEQIPRAVVDGVDSFVLDAECTAWQKADEANGQKARLLPFQELSKRKRKDIKVEDIKVKVKLFAFDLLYLNGEPLLHLDLAQRREKLFKSFNPVADEFDYTISKECISSEEIQTFLDESVKEGCEGLMVKTLQGEEATYEPSRRSIKWLKVKKDYLAGTGDSLDLVVIGAYYGKGKRTNVYGAFLLACYDSDNESYQAVCKLGTGFSEEDLELHHSTLKELEVAGKRGYYDVGEAKPDVYFEPKVVWEVLAADLSLSPVYTAAKGLVEQRGISLRFPRYIRIRDDKEADDATGPEQIAEMYRKQATASKSGKGGADEDDGYW